MISSRIEMADKTLFGVKLNRDSINPADMNAAIRAGGIAFASAAVMALIERARVRSIDNTADLGVNVDAVGQDAKLTKALVQLKKLEAVDEQLYVMLVMNCDALMVLETALRQSSTVPVEKDRILAYMHFSNTKANLAELKALATKAYGPIAGSYVATHGKVVLECLGVHLTNVVRRVTSYNPSRTMDSVIDQLTSAQRRAIIEREKAKHNYPIYQNYQIP